MRRFALVSAAAVLTLGGSSVGLWSAPVNADDPPNTIVSSPLPNGADLQIRAAGTHTIIGDAEQGNYPPQQVRQDIPQFGRAISYLRACSVDHKRTQRIRLHGAHSTFTWKVRYRTLGGTDLTKQVVAGTYRTPRLRPGRCHVIKMIVALQPDQGQYDHVFAVRAVPDSGPRDVVSAWVHITGVIVVP